MQVMAISKLDRRNGDEGALTTKNEMQVSEGWNGLW